MSLTEAQALASTTTFLPHDPDADLRELCFLADVCQQFSPAVSHEFADKTHCLLLDISGCAHLFCGEGPLACRLSTQLARYNYYAHLAVADTIGAAWALARHGHARQDNSLTSLPIRALRLPDKVRDGLKDFDLRTIDQLAALPRESLPSRFGVALLERLDQLTGQVDELLTPLPFPDPITTGWASDDPINHPKAIQIVCEDLLADLLLTLRRENRGLLQLNVFFHSEGRDPTELHIRLSLPTQTAKHVLTLLELQLETTRLPDWLCAIDMEAAITAPLVTQQRSLFSEQVSTDGQETRRLIDRLAARLGTTAVVQAKFLPEFIPEKIVQWQEVSDLHSTAVSSQPARSHRPLLLLTPPERLQVVVRKADDGTSQPAVLEWQRQRFVVTQWTSAERFSTDWWDHAGTVRRDYYCIDTDSGNRFWIFKNDQSHWYLHGVFE